MVMSVVLVGEGLPELQVSGVARAEDLGGLIGEAHGFPGGLKWCIGD